MEANSRPLLRIFEPTVCYQIPLFQRPYVWKREDNWQPLWEDFERLLGVVLAGEKLRPHFLGAVVLEQLRNDTGSVQGRQVIDGQQRFTTLQLLLIAARDLCCSRGSERFAGRFESMVSNSDTMVDDPSEVPKLLPTNADRHAFALVHGAGSPDALLQQASKKGVDFSYDQGIVGAYLYFYGQFEEWLRPEAAEAEESPDKQLDALWAVVRNGLQLVVIDLGEDDESQVIFETLNARGTQLLPADLIKNFLFRRAQSEGGDIDTLYEEHWAEFDGEFWREEVKQGRENRPRIDIFIRHFLTLAMRRDIRVGHIFNEYKNYVQYTADWGSCFIDPANSASEHMALLKTYAEHFRQFSSPAAGSRLAHFLARLVVIDTSTVYPLLLLCSQRLRPQQQTEFEAILTVLESYLFRRMICGLTTKNYNRLFLDLIRHLEREKQITAQVVGAFLLSSEGESVRFPKDGELSNALLDYPLYQWWPQYRVRAVLKALERALAHAKSEAVSLPTGLTIEHILPVKWQEHWPLPAEVQNDPQANVEFSQRRDRIKHTLGNLTLVTSSLNPALSNSAWAAKKPELLKWSKLNLSRDLHDHEEWSEQEILARGAALAKSAIQIWPYPDVDR
ncbi:DUF262 domain-containing protein [Pseudomonas aeruginosa]|uniref:DUF262 domain-containing protein n=1 Tax=Pseudomonas aeruginosa TaxID=287 RepID=UPI00053F1796|nr:DUF262 domain-containing protein [Pseudomonas aeruginosa]EKU7805037.1 DUF262 domain-containing protein [Pseudomonas aeruginosa]EKV3146436.1 DUF262 domain-containing protein [Pseudomonas aeruginosa]EKV6520643.1 DUF262 domain-containing protein [Pseudomonas aeruginosa]EKW5130269.1 DUF262 domain-containing protein [Pseudomonas aeruginosa]EKX3432768.1 DUF262 domain-containing protein [Pseudomonas aeruginosa]